MAELDLVPIEARLDAWIRQRRSFSLPTFANSIDYVAAKEQFIARAPEDIAALVAEVERLMGQFTAVRDLHKPVPVGKPEAHWGGCICPTCGLLYPCPTIRALGGEES